MGMKSIAKILKISKKMNGIQDSIHRNFSDILKSETNINTISNQKIENSKEFTKKFIMEIDTVFLNSWSKHFQNKDSSILKKK